MNHTSTTKRYPQLFGMHRLLCVATLLMIWAITNPGYAQSNERLIGRVYDAQSGAPIAGAFVQLVSTVYGTQTDVDGFFRIENVPPGEYSLRVTMIGYATQTVSGVTVSPDVPRRVEVALSPLPIGVDSILIIAHRQSDEASLAGERVVLTEVTIQRYRTLGMAQLLQQVAGVEVASAGGGNSRAIIRIHGSSGNQVLVLLDGQRLNNPQTGEVDLSNIPIEQIERIEVIRQGNTALYGSNAFAGVIAFHTRRKLISSYLSGHTLLGSFDTAVGSAEAGLSIHRLTGILQYQQEYSRQNFPYQYQGETIIRENAWYRNRKLFTRWNYQSAHQRMGVLYHFTHGKQGLPSALYNELKHFNAFKTGNEHTLQFSHRWFWGAHGFSNILLGYRRLNQHFNNERDFSPFTRYNTRQQNEILEAQFTLDWFPLPTLETRWGASYVEERLNHENLLYPDQSIGEKQRLSKAVYGGVEWQIPKQTFLWKSAQLRAALRVESYFNQPAQGYPVIGFTLVPSMLPNASVSVNRARGIRYPDFNSLFWKGDARARGNPELLPEENSIWNGSFRYHPGSRLFPEINLYLYSEQIRNLIIWHRTVSGVWEPRNEQKATRRGMDIQLTYHPLPDFFNVQMGYSYIQAKNKSNEPNRYNKAIPFIPRHTLDASLWGSWKDFHLLLNYRWVDQRHTVAANTAPPLSAYHLWNISLGYQRHLGYLKGEFTLAAKNIFNTSYELLFGYPMPGRSLQLSVKLTFNHH